MSEPSFLTLRLSGEPFFLFFFILHETMRKQARPTGEAISNQYRLLTQAKPNSAYLTYER